MTVLQTPVDDGKIAAKWFPKVKLVESSLTFSKNYKVAPCTAVQELNDKLWLEGK